MRRGYALRGKAGRFLGALNSLLRLLRLRPQLWSIAETIGAVMSICLKKTYPPFPFSPPPPHKHFLLLPPPPWSPNAFLHRPHLALHRTPPNLQHRRPYQPYSAM